MSKRIVTVFLALVSGLAQASEAGKLMSDLETQTLIEQKRLALMQAKAATATFAGTGGLPLPQIVSLYSAAGKARALVDMGAAGIRDVGPGDALTDTLVVNRIDANRGVEVRVLGASKGSKATLFLTMKAAAQVGTPSATVPGNTDTSPGYPLVPAGLSVPPLQPASPR
ncbi:MAG: hypothetical protein WBH52_08365 [Pseudomonas aeruginosa]